MGKRAPTFDELKNEYSNLLSNAVIVPRWEAEAKRNAQAIVNARPQLAEVEAHTGVPWWVVGVIQCMEAGISQHGALRLDCHLHNGDPLTHQTVNKPAGRIPGRSGPFTFLESAIDAIRCDELDKVDWSNGAVEPLLYRLEAYNGWGVRQYHPDVLSAYLWSGTNQYKRGKYVADGKWSDTAVSGQIGAVPIIVALKEMDVAPEPKSDPVLTTADGAAVDTETSPAVPAPRWPEADQEKGTASQGEIAKDSRSMSMFQWLKWKCGVGGGTFGIYEISYFFKGQSGTLHDINKFIGDNAAILIGAFLFACLVSACLGGYYLAEAHREGRYDPRKPVTV